MPPSDRIHWLDGTRAVAISLVVLAHGLAPFLHTDVGWAVHEPSRVLVVDGVVWVVRSFVMPLFFLLSGLWAAATVSRSGVGGLLVRRGQRLLVPLLVLVVPISMAMNALWDWGKSLDPSRVVTAGAVPELRASDLAITLGHLWFLYYLVVVTIGAAVLLSIARRIGVAGRGQRAPLSLVAACLAWLPMWWSEKLQLDTPLGLGVDVPIALFHALFFGWGFLLFSRKSELGAYAKRLWAHLAVAGACFAGLLPILIDSVGDATGAPLWAFALSGGFSVATVAAVLGICARLLPAPNAAVRLVGAASYWTYILHLPLLVLMQVAVHELPIPGALKYAVAVAVTGSVCLLSYRYVIRPTWLRRYLG